MSDQYLWDRTGPVDPEVAALEDALVQYRFAPRLGWPLRRAWATAAVAAAVVIGIAIALLRPAPTAAGWEIAGTKTYVGQVVKTAETSLTLESDDIGRLEMAPESELRIAESGPERQRIALRRGTMHALIWAPPRQFVVETPSAHAIDLGCEYTLSVHPDGSGMLRVETGWVAFQHRKLESFIPAGAACRTHAASGPGIPFYEDAPETFRSELERYENDRDAVSLRKILDAARAKDGLTLWHLLARTNGQDRAAVFDRYSALVLLPATVTREAVVAGDPGALDASWNALGLEGTEWWREWKQKW